MTPPVEQRSRIADMPSEDHERIWLQNANDARYTETGRLWCEDKVWPDDTEDGEPTEYVRADLVDGLVRSADASGYARGRAEAVEDECAAFNQGWHRRSGYGGKANSEDRDEAWRDYVYRKSLSQKDTRHEALPEKDSSNG